MLLALGLFLASIHLGPEIPLGTRTIGAAPNSQYSPAAAWNGHSGLAVWIDDRGRYPADSAWIDGFVEGMARVSPMRNDGSLVNPAGSPLFRALALRLASNGNSFMLAYADRAGTHVVPLDDNGAIDGADTLVIAGYPRYFDIVSNGHTFLFASPSDFTVEADVFQPSGVLYARKTFATPNWAGSEAVATTIGGVYAVGYRDPALHVVFMADDAATTDQIVYADREAARGRLSMTASDDRVMLALGGDGDVRTMIVARDGHVIAPMQQLFHSNDIGSDPWQPALWDGSSFLVTWRMSDNTMRAAALSPDNTLLDPPGAIDLPAVIATRAPHDLTFTRTSDRYVAIWHSDNDVLRRTFTSNDDLLSQPPAETPLVLDVQTQSEESLAETGDEPLRIWREGQREPRIELSIAGKTIDVASATDRRDLRDPSVARGGNVVLAVWRELPDPYAGAIGYRIYARRFALDGTALDPQPLLLEKNDAYPTDVELGTAVTFDGRNFVAFWSSPHVRAARVSPNGTLVDNTPFVFEGPADIGFDSGMQAIPRGEDITIAWSSWNDYRYILGISPRPGPVSAAQVARIDTRGGEMRLIDARTLWQTRALSKRAGLAHDVVISANGSCVQANLLASNAAVDVECAAGIEHSSIAWNGSEYVVVWSRNGDVRAIRLDRSLRAIDDGSFSVAGGYEPVVAANAKGVEIDYVRLDNDIPRLFARTLDRLGPVIRRAAASRTSR